MIPVEKKEDPDPTEFNHTIQFSLFGKTFSLSFKVNKKQE